MEQLADNIRAAGYVVQDIKLIGIEEGGDKINISKRHSSRLSLMDRLLPIPFFIEKIFMLHKIPGAILVFYDLSLDILEIF